MKTQPWNWKQRVLLATSGVGGDGESTCRVTCSSLSLASWGADDWSLATVVGVWRTRRTRGRYLRMEFKTICSGDVKQQSELYQTTSHRVIALHSSFAVFSGEQLAFGFFIPSSSALSGDLSVRLSVYTECIRVAVRWSNERQQSLYKWKWKGFSSPVRWVQTRPYSCLHHPVNIEDIYPRKIMGFAEYIFYHSMHPKVRHSEKSNIMTMHTESTMRFPIVPNCTYMHRVGHAH